MSKRFQSKNARPQPVAAASPVSATASAKKPRKNGPAPFTVGLRPEAIAARGGQQAMDPEDDSIEPPKLTDPIPPDRGMEVMPIEKVLEGLGKIWCTTKEVSAFLGITEKTLFKMFRNEPRARELYEQGKLLGNISQRHRNVKLATAGNPAMNIFISKNVLGMRDHFDVAGTVTHEHNVLIALYQQITRGKAGKIIEGEVVAPALPAPAAKVIEEA